ncbi:thioredoxin-dependent thiol peroxidase [Candidatus Micrarchaeota archaeon]|nr:thioredoxin-dependent thiol peroxidase [Candidatus Micrarchaeota archaeon]
MRKSVKEGVAAPDFTLKDQHGKKVTLSKLRGKKVILYFYPKDFTPGCTNEACEFRDLHEQLKKLDYVVLAVSADSVESHKKFAAKYKLPFQILSDEDNSVAKAYDSYGEKVFFGHKIAGVKRNTFLIDDSGVVKKAFWKVVPVGHAKKFLRVI